MSIHVNITSRFTKQSLLRTTSLSKTTLVPNDWRASCKNKSFIRLLHHHKYILYTLFCRASIHGPISDSHLDTRQLSANESPVTWLPPTNGNVLRHHEGHITLITIRCSIGQLNIFVRLPLLSNSSEHVQQRNHLSCILYVM